MKYKIIGACMICLLSVTTKMYASASKTNDGFDVVVNKYINSIVTSNYKELRGVLDENLRFNIPRLKLLRIYKKSTVVDDVKSRNCSLQDCNPGYVVLAQSDGLNIVEVDFTYGDTVIQNFVFLGKDQDDEWKITQVYELYKTIDSIRLPNTIALSK